VSKKSLLIKAKWSGLQVPVRKIFCFRGNCQPCNEYKNILVACQMRRRCNRRLALIEKKIDRSRSELYFNGNLEGSERKHMREFIHLVNKMTKTTDRQPVCGGVDAFGEKH